MFFLWLAICFSSLSVLARADVFSDSPAFSEVFETHGTVLLLIEPATGHIVDANPAAAKFYGHSRSHLQQMTIQQINTLTKEQVKEEREMAQSEGRNYFIFRHELASGEIRTVAVNSNPFTFSGRELLLSSINDITPGRHGAQALWHYQSKLEERVDKQVQLLEEERQQKIWILWGGILLQTMIILGLIVSVRKGQTLRRELSSQRQSLENIIWGTDVGTWEWNALTGDLNINPRWAETMGYTLGELEPVSIDTWCGLVNPDDLPSVKAEMKKHFAGESDAYCCEVRMKHKAGHWVWVLDRGKVVTWNEQGEPEWISGTHTEITARKQAEESLRQAASVFEHANEGIMITDEKGVIQNVNLAFTSITGYGRDEIIGNNPRIFSSGYHDAAYFEQMWRSLSEEGRWTNEIWNRRKNGEVFAAIQTVSAIKDENGQLLRYVSLFSDITALKQQQKQLEKIAHYDALTGLPNRVLLSDRLQQAIAQSKRHKNLLAVAFFDLDGFKVVNDSHGHNVGDKLLVELAERSKQELREGDSLARLGGDEFVVVLRDLNSTDECIPVLERLLVAISKPTYINHVEITVSASIGITFFPQADEIDADQLIRQADQAMYVAKQSGKNRYHIFDTEHDRSIRGHHDQLIRLQDALEQGEFELFYQPKVNMRSGQVIGAEALIRWQHPQKGLVLPADFLPTISSSAALVVAVGDWIIDQALSQIDLWRQQGLHIPISVNIDALHLQIPDFVERLKAKLERYPDTQPGDLELEVLETSALNDIKRISSIINECSDIGVNFALDDFGTGYSSLTYLKQLPAHLLKIDRSFVCDMLEDLEDLSILEGVIGLASAFRCQTIAEGVETIEQGEMLLMMGCELAQGYVIARPMPAADMTGFVGSWRPDEAWIGKEEIERDNLPLLFALVEHRAWSKAVLGYLQSTSVNIPEGLNKLCQFGLWLNKLDESRYLGQKDLIDIRYLHEKLHQQSLELTLLKKQGQSISENQVVALETRLSELEKRIRSALI